MIRAVVFDFDGVLVESEPLHLRALQEVLAPLGIGVARDEYYARYLGFDDEAAFRAIATDRGLEFDDRQVAALRAAKSELFDSFLDADDLLYPGARACVERLAAAYPLGIASGAQRHEIVSVLRANGLDRHFGFIVASGETPSGKPAPDPYFRAAALLGLSPSVCAAVEDSRWGIDAARLAGMRCVGITHTYAAPDLPGADVVVHRLDEITVDLMRAL
jgi:beta-phosphoglucomutase